MSLEKIKKFWDSETDFDMDSDDYHPEGILGYDEVISAKSFKEVLEREVKRYSECTEKDQNKLKYEDGIEKAYDLYRFFQKIYKTDLNQEINSIGCQKYKDNMQELTRLRRINDLNFRANEKLNQEINRLKEKNKNKQSQEKQLGKKHGK